MAKLKKEEIFYTWSWSLDCFHCKTKNLTDYPFPLQILTLCPQISIVWTHWMAYKNLTFWINNLFSLKHGFRMFSINNLTMTFFVMLITFLPWEHLWQPSISECDILISEPLHILRIFFSKSWSGIVFETPEISTLFCQPYCSLLISVFLS